MSDPVPAEGERTPGIDSTIDAAARAAAREADVDYDAIPGRVQAGWRDRAEVVIRAWQEHRRRTAEESVPESHRKLLRLRAELDTVRRQADASERAANNFYSIGQGFRADRDRLSAENAELREQLERSREWRDDWHGRYMKARAELARLQAERTVAPPTGGGATPTIGQYPQPHEFGDWGDAAERLDAPVVEDPDGTVSVSTDHGKTWSEPEPVTVEDGTFTARAPAPTPDPAREILARLVELGDLTHIGAEWLTEFSAICDASRALLGRPDRG